MINPAIATLFSAKTVPILNKALVYAEGFNKNYEGEIKGKGDVLRIFSFGRPTVSATDPDATLTYEDYTPTSQELRIDRDSKWAISQDQLERMLAKVDGFNEATKQGAWAMADEVDRHLATVLYNASQVLDATPVVVGNGAGETTAYKFIEMMREGLKENSNSGDDLHIAIPVWLMTRLRTDPAFSSFGTEMNRKTARGEAIMELAGLTIHETLNALDANGAGFSISGDGDDRNAVLAWWRGAATHGFHIPAEGLVQIIPAAQNPNNFKDLMRSRQVWGATVTVSKAVVRLTAEKGAL